MRRVLHILTQPNPLADSVIDEHRAQSSVEVEVIVLDDNADYDRLVESIFASDSINVW